MTPRQRRQLQFGAALAVSAAAHVGALRLRLPQPPAAHIEPVAMTVRIDIEPAEELPPVRVQPEDEVQLGLDVPRPPLESWLGFMTPEFHAAAKAETDQAAFDDRPRGEPEALSEAPYEAPTEEAAQPAPVVDVPQPDQPAPEQDQSDTPERAAEQPEPAEQLPVEQSPAEPSRSPPPHQDFNVLARILSLPAGDFDAVLAAANDPGSPKPDLATEKQGAKDDQESTPKNDLHEDSRPPRENLSEQPPAPKAPTLQVANPAAPGRAGSRAPAGAPIAAELSDRQSDPTSVIEVSAEHWKLGKPLAGAGLELRPRKPAFTPLMLMTASPGNPLAEIRFRADGVPASARLLASSGDGRVDDAVLSSLYRWRAAGEELRKLAESETLEVRIKLVLNSRGG